MQPQANVRADLAALIARKDVAALRDDILANGGALQGELTEITEGIAAGLRGLYMRDPHGVLIELVELPAK